MRYHRANPAIYYIVGGMAAVILLVYSVKSLTGRIFHAAQVRNPVSESQTDNVSSEKTDEFGVSDDDLWKLLLINAANPLPAGYESDIDFTKLRGDIWVDERFYGELQDMMDACRNEGLHPVICTGYRTRSDQQKLFQSELNKLTISGYSLENATIEAQKKQPLAGCSEHNAALAVDIVPEDNQYLTEDQEDSPELQWLTAHCYEYGFIPRYPKDKTDITGVRYAPWHFRYVGKPTALYMKEHGLCLEEYLERFNAAKNPSSDISSEEGDDGWGEWN